MSMPIQFEYERKHYTLYDRPDVKEKLIAFSRQHGHRIKRALAWDALQKNKVPKSEQGKLLHRLGFSAELNLQRKPIHYAYFREFLRLLKLFRDSNGTEPTWQDHEAFVFLTQELHIAFLSKEIIPNPSPFVAGIRDLVHDLYKCFVKHAKRNCTHAELERISNLNKHTADQFVDAQPPARKRLKISSQPAVPDAFPSIFGVQTQQEGGLLDDGSDIENNDIADWTVHALEALFRDIQTPQDLANATKTQELVLLHLYGYLCWKDIDLAESRARHELVNTTRGEWKAFLDRPEMSRVMLELQKYVWPVPGVQQQLDVKKAFQTTILDPSANANANSNASEEDVNLLDMQNANDSTSEDVKFLNEYLNTIFHFLAEGTHEDDSLDVSNDSPKITIELAKTILDKLHAEDYFVGGERQDIFTMTDNVIKSIVTRPPLTQPAVISESRYPSLSDSALEDSETPGTLTPEPSQAPSSTSPASKQFFVHPSMNTKELTKMLENIQHEEDKLNMGSSEDDANSVNTRELDKLQRLRERIERILAEKQQNEQTKPFARVTDTETMTIVVSSSDATPVHALDVQFKSKYLDEVLDTLQNMDQVQIGWQEKQIDVLVDQKQHIASQRSKNPKSKIQQLQNDYTQAKQQREAYNKATTVDEGTKAEFEKEFKRTEAALLKGSDDQELYEQIVKREHKMLLNLVRRSTNNYVQLHLDYAFKPIRRKLAYVLRWEQEFKQKKEIVDRLQKGGQAHALEDEVLIALVKDYDETYRPKYTQLENSIKSIKDAINNFSVKYLSAYKTAVAEIDLDAIREEHEREELIDRADQMEQYIMKVHNKISRMYSTEFNIMDFIFDSQFISLYVLKVLHYLILLLSLYFADKIFSEKYMKTVYGDGQDPPDLLQFIGIFLGINVAMLAFLFLIMVLLMYLFKTPTNNFVIDSKMLGKGLMDAGFFLLIFTLFNIVLAMTVQKKKYFRYKTEGLRGIRAMKELMMSFGAMLIMIPYFAFY